MRSQNNFSNRNRGRYGRSRTTSTTVRSRGYGRPYETDIYEREYTRYPESEYYSGRGTESTERGRGYQGRHDDRNIFERAGDTIREKWNDWTDRDRDSDRYENDYRVRNEYETENRYGRGTSGEYRSNQRGRGRNVIGRLGRRVREAWDDLTDRDYDEQYGNYGQQNRYYDYDNDNRRSQMTNRYGRTRRYTDTW